MKEGDNIDHKEQDLDMWIPTVLEKAGADLNTSQNYSECICPNCKKTTVHHIGVPCQHYTCPECGVGKLERRGEHEKNIKESENLTGPKEIVDKIIHLIETDGNSVADITKEKVNEVLTQYLTESSRVIKQSELENGNVTGELMVVRQDGSSVTLNTYLEDYLRTIVKSGQKMKKNIVTPKLKRSKLSEIPFPRTVKSAAKKVKDMALRPRSWQPAMGLHKAYWSAKPGKKIMWPAQPSETASDIASAIH